MRLSTSLGAADKSRPRGIDVDEKSAIAHLGRREGAFGAYCDAGLVHVLNWHVIFIFHFLIMVAECVKNFGKKAI